MDKQQWWENDATLLFKAVEGDNSDEEKEKWVDFPER